MAEGFTIDMKTILDGAVLNWAEASDETKTKEGLRSLITVYDRTMNETVASENRPRIGTS